MRIKETRIVLLPEFDYGLKAKGHVNISIEVPLWLESSVGHLRNISSTFLILHRNINIFLITYGRFEECVDRNGDHVEIVELNQKYSQKSVNIF